MTEIAGVGLTFSKQDGFLFVTSIAEESPAAQDGTVRTGDVLVSVDRENVEGQTLMQVKEKVMGPSGSVVTLGFVRKDETTGNLQPFNVMLRRSSAKNQAPDSASKLANFHARQMQLRSQIVSSSTELSQVRQTYSELQDYANRQKIIIDDLQAKLADKDVIIRDLEGRTHNSLEVESLKNQLKNLQAEYARETETLKSRLRIVQNEHIQELDALRAEADSARAEAARWRQEADATRHLYETIQVETERLRTNQQQQDQLVHHQLQTQLETHLQSQHIELERAHQQQLQRLEELRSAEFEKIQQTRALEIQRLDQERQRELLRMQEEYNAKLQQMQEEVLKSKQVQEHLQRELEKHRDVMQQNTSREAMQQQIQQQQIQRHLSLQEQQAEQERQQLTRDLQQEIQRLQLQLTDQAASIKEQQRLWEMQFVQQVQQPLQKDLTERQAEIRQLEADRTDLQTRIHHLQLENTTLEHEINELRASRHTWEHDMTLHLSRLQAEQSARKQAESAIATHAKKIRELEEKLSTKNSDELLLRAKIDDLQRRDVTSQAVLQEANRIVRERERENSTLSQATRKIDQELNIYTTELMKERKERKQKEEELAIAMKCLRETEAHLKTAQYDAGVAQRRYEEVLGRYQHTQADVETLFSERQSLQMSRSQDLEKIRQLQAIVAERSRFAADAAQALAIEQRERLRQTEEARALATSLRGAERMIREERGLPGESLPATYVPEKAIGSA